MGEKARERAGGKAGTPAEAPTRREFLVGVSAAPVLACAASSEISGGSMPRRPVAIASANGLRATAKAIELVRSGHDPLDAAIAGVNIVEGDPNDISVGYGGLPNEDGVVELDAAVMHGPTHRCGAVAALRGIKYPSKVAKLVMERTDHVLLVGEGAQRFAVAHGFPIENLLTERARKIWLHWKETRSAIDDWLPPPPKEVDPEVRRFFGERVTGTIHCSVLDTKGDLAAVTTTSGLAFKIPGRVGDSPIIGAGLYVDNDIGAAGSTGRGEANLANCSCAMIVEWMGRGMHPMEACLEMLRRVAKHTKEKRLLRPDGRPNFQLVFYAVNKNGEYGAASMWKGRKFAVHDGSSNRLEDCAYLFE